MQHCESLQLDKRELAGYDDEQVEVAPALDEVTHAPRSTKDHGHETLRQQILQPFGQGHDDGRLSRHEIDSRASIDSTG